MRYSSMPMFIVRAAVIIWLHWHATRRKHDGDIDDTPSYLLVEESLIDDGLQESRSEIISAFHAKYSNYHSHDVISLFHATTTHSKALAKAPPALWQKLCRDDFEPPFLSLCLILMITYFEANFHWMPRESLLISLPPCLPAGKVGLPVMRDMRSFLSFFRLIYIATGYSFDVDDGFCDTGLSLRTSFFDIWWFHCKQLTQRLMAALMLLQSRRITAFARGEGYISFDFILRYIIVLYFFLLHYYHRRLFDDFSPCAEWWCHGHTQ